MDSIGRILSGSIDMHLHHGPDYRTRRSVDALEAARQAQALGMKAIVLKSHAYATGPLAYIIRQSVPGLQIIGSVTLDSDVGGLNSKVVETSAKLGARVAWMPTYTSANEIKKKGLSGEGLTVLDTGGSLLPAVSEVLRVIKEQNMVLATGHLSVAEAFTLVEAARKIGIKKIVVTHALLDKVGTLYSLAEQRRMVELGAYIEHCFCITLPLHARLDPMKIVEAVREVGSEHCILSTDLGQEWNPPPAEGMRMMVATMLKCGLREEQIELMIKKNPSVLLDLG